MKSCMPVPFAFKNQRSKILIPKSSPVRTTAKAFRRTISQVLRFSANELQLIEHRCRWYAPTADNGLRFWYNESPY